MKIKKYFWIVLIIAVFTFFLYVFAKLGTQRVTNSLWPIPLLVIEYIQV